MEHRAKTGLTPLMEAASGGYEQVGRILLEKGADVNAPPVHNSKDTALIIASEKGHAKFATLLIEYGAQLDAKNKKGCTALWLACFHGHLDVVQTLVNHRADADSCDSKRISCLMSAFRRGHVKICKYLVKHVRQFPGDQDCVRYINSLIQTLAANANSVAVVTPNQTQQQQQQQVDKELIRQCQQCLEIIKQAKDKQEQEANRVANSLLKEIDEEKSREQTKKAAAQRKREKKKLKKLQQQNNNPTNAGLEAAKNNENEDDDDDDEDYDNDNETKIEVISIKQDNDVKEKESATKIVTENKNASSNSKKKNKKKNKSKGASNNSEKTFLEDKIVKINEIKNKKEEYERVSARHDEIEVASPKESTNTNRLVEIKLNDLDNYDEDEENEETRVADFINEKKTSYVNDLEVDLTKNDNSITNKRSSSNNQKNNQQKLNSTKKSQPSFTQSSKHQISNTDNNKEFQKNSGENNKSQHEKLRSSSQQVLQQQRSKSQTNATTTGLETNTSTKTQTHHSKVNANNKPVINSYSAITNSSTKKTSSANIPSYSNIATTKQVTAKQTNNHMTSSLADLDDFDQPTPVNSQKTAPKPSQIANQKQQRIIVPYDKFIKVMGRSNANIRMIQDITGATFEIEDKKIPPNQDRSLMIRAETSECIRYACELIQALISDSDIDLSNLLPGNNSTKNKWTTSKSVNSNASLSANTSVYNPFGGVSLLKANEQVQQQKPRNFAEAVALSKHPIQNLHSNTGKYLLLD
jgi:hypothetical protein